MSRKVTIRFNYARRYSGHNADGGYEIWVSELERDYYVTMDVEDEQYVRFTFSNGFYVSFYHPGVSDSYKLVREGWETDSFPVGEAVFPAVMSPCKPILESTVIMTIEPTRHNSLNSLATSTEYLIYKLPRILNGLLVDRGRVDQETVADRANPECVGELKGVASFLLSSRNNNLRYTCVSFRIDNKTTKKNLTKQYGCGSVCTS